MHLSVDKTVDFYQRLYEHVWKMIEGKVPDASILEGIQDYLEIAVLRKNYFVRRRIRKYKRRFMLLRNAPGGVSRVEHSLYSILCGLNVQVNIAWTPHGFAKPPRVEVPLASRDMNTINGLAALRKADSQQEAINDLEKMVKSTATITTAPEFECATSNLNPWENWDDWNPKE